MLCFFDLTFGKETAYEHREMSKCNNKEAHFVWQLLKECLTFVTATLGLGSEKEALKHLQGRIAVITPYKKQVQVLRSLLET